jgi:hypothetical protein
MAAISPSHDRQAKQLNRPSLNESTGVVECVWESAWFLCPHACAVPEKQESSDLGRSEFPMTMAILRGF